MIKKTMKYTKAGITVVLSSLLLSACIYTPTVQQGKNIPSSELKQLKLSMSKQQVKQLLGTPMAQASTAQAKWTYVSYQFQNQQSTQKHVILTFNKKGKLIKIETRAIG